jgi:hypothetical protein
MKLALISSIEQGHLNPKHVTVSGDGSVLETYASAHPRSICGCRSKGIYRCRCAKPSTSKTATWCWDEYRGIFLFGDCYYHLMTTQNGHDFPLLTHMPGGYESDYTLSLKGVDRLLKASQENGAELELSLFTGDGHQDCYAMYRYASMKGIKPVIPLSESSQNVRFQIEGFDLSQEGIPLCPYGAKMRHHQYDERKQRHVWTCPAKRPTHRHGIYQYVFRPELCPIQQDCKQSSVMGPLVYIPTETNPRYFPPIPRSSARFQKIYHERSATERKNHTKKNVYKLNRSTYRAEYAQIRLGLVDILVHMKIWYEEANKKMSRRSIFQRCLQKLDRRGCSGEAVEARCEAPAEGES